MKKIFSASFLIFCTVMLHAEKLPQRTEICLDGIWEFTPIGQEKTSIIVPDYWDAHPEFKKVDRAIYERIVQIPDTKDWESKILKIEFEGVNFIADVYINDELVFNHIGGWVPFTIDITRFVKAGESCRLKVDVKGGSYQPIVDEGLNPQWPVGFSGHTRKWGIIFDVWLRAFGKIHTNDVFIKTSFRNKRIYADLEICNTDIKERKISIISTIVPALTPELKSLVLKSNPFTIKGEEVRIISLESSWEQPSYWSPANPFLYYLITEIVDVKTGEVIDRRNDRFGFREIWAEGNRIMFNGHAMTILGANIVQHSEFYDNQRYYYMTPETWNQTIDRLFELNLRTVRFHMQPAPLFILDIADERGLLIMDESAIYAREYILKSNKKVYLENCIKWIGPWVKARRNHPSVIIWNAENEMGAGWLKWMTESEMKSLGDAIRLYDKTRLVNYDGDRDVGDALINMHYPEGYTNTVSGSIYAWADSVSSIKPTGVGEFITHYGKNGNINQWWQGTWVRGMRYVYFADIRPYRHDWAILRSDNTPCIENLINSLSPVALFDKEYDDLGIDPLVNRNYPYLQPGDTVNRTFILYNDEFEDEIIDIEVLVKSSELYPVLYHYNGDRSPMNKIIASDRNTYIVPLGEHVDIPYTLIVPSLYEGFTDGFTIEMIARKKGVVKFRETIKFNIRNFENKESVIPKINLLQAKKPGLK